MKYDFDRMIDRKNTNSLKHDFAVERGMPEDILSLWVADMDFASPDCIREALMRQVQHGVFGYSDIKPGYTRAVTDWYQNYFNYTIRPEHIVTAPGVVFAIAAAIQAFTGENDSVLIQEPVYYPFRAMIRQNNRNVVNNELKYTAGHYEIDFTDFEEKIKNNQVKLFILCSPHNPVGRVWKRWELEKMAEICHRYHVLVISDEIHSDFVYENNTHTVFATLSETTADMTITCTSPSKTFNIAGLQAANIIIADEEKRKLFIKAIHRTGHSSLNNFAIAGVQAAYEGGREWLDQLKEYLAGNLSLIRNYLREYLPQIHLVEPEGTYLAWLDCRDLGLTEQERERLLVHQAGLWLDTGSMFGEAGTGFERINIACPRSTIKTALDRLAQALQQDK